jgi:uroporphyrinogen decarboxylase
MNSRERVLRALNKGIPDMVPYMYNCIDQDLQERILGAGLDCETVNAINSWGNTQRPGDVPKPVNPVYTVAPAVADKLKLDAIGIQILPPLFVDSEIHDGRADIRDGLLFTREAYENAVMPDPDDDKLYKKLESMLARVKGERAVYARIRLGASPTLLSMGVMGFSYALCDDPALVNDILAMYTKWSHRVIRNLCELDFDFFWCFDDIAYKTSPLFSLETFTTYFLPNLQHAAQAITRPWVFHSDGNILPLLPELIKLGMSGIHPLEPGSMNLDVLKNEYGKKLCLIGNIDVDKTLSRGSVADVYTEVEARISQLGAGGGYIISDSNSVPGYCRPENVTAMAAAVEKFRKIY